MKQTPRKGPSAKPRGGLEKLTAPISSEGLKQCQDFSSLNLGLVGLTKARTVDWPRTIVTSPE